MMKDKIEKKINYIKGFKIKKIAIKKIKLKIKIKNKLEGSPKFFIGELNWKKIQKQKKLKEWKLNWKKTIEHKLRLNDKTKNQ